MKLDKMLAAIPEALQTLHDAGHERAYLDELGQQMLRGDEAYMRRRNALRRFLGYAGIHIAELPHGSTHPNSGLKAAALAQLRLDGVVQGGFEEPREDGEVAKSVYWLPANTVAPEVAVPTILPEAPNA